MLGKDEPSLFFWIMVGQTIGAIGQSFQIQGPPKVAAVWFGDRERSIATTIGALAGPLGSVIGFIFPVFFVHTPDGRTEPELVTIREEVRTYMFWQSVYVTVCVAPILLLGRSKPRYPPSMTSLQDSRAKQPFCLNLKRLVSSSNFILLTGSYSLFFSIQQTLGATVGPITDKFGYEASDVSLFGGCFIICGLIGSIFHAIVLDRFKRYKRQFLFIIFGALPCFGFICLGLQLTIPWLMSICIGIYGSSLIPIIGVGNSFAAMEFLPISPAASIGII